MLGMFCKQRSQLGFYKKLCVNLGFGLVKVNSIFPRISTSSTETYVCSKNYFLSLKLFALFIEVLRVEKMFTYNFKLGCWHLNTGVGSAWAF